MSIYRWAGPVGVASAYTTAMFSTKRYQCHVRCNEPLVDQTSAGWRQRVDSSMQRYDRLAAKLWHATRPGVATQRQNASQTKVIRVVLTGGPCAGKSSCLEHLRTAATAAGYDVYLCPEVATLFLNNGAAFPTDPEAVCNFQLQILRLQLAFERSFTAIASSTGQPSILITDRGLLDGKSYVTDAVWETLLNRTEASERGLDSPRQTITEDYMLKRYDVIVHLVTAADGAKEHYKWGETTDDDGNKVVRGEPPEKAMELDIRVRAAWASHPNHCIIPNGPKGMEGKMQQCTAAILNYANKIQPQPKFLKERVHELEREAENLKRTLQSLGHDI